MIYRKYSVWIKCSNSHLTVHMIVLLTYYLEVCCRLADFTTCLRSMEKYIQESLPAGIIRLSSSPEVAGFFFVPKRDGFLRPRIDYRGMNDITIKNKYPLPLIYSAFESIQGANVFTKLDLHNAYHLVRIRKVDEWKAHLWDILNTSLCHLG